MKLLLLERQTFRQYYRYFATFISILLFTLMLFFVGVFKPLDNGSTLDVPFLVVLGAYTLSIPLILFSHLYHETNVHFVSSLPVTRMEMFISKYLLGLIFGLTVILGYCSLTTLLVGTQALWIQQVTHYLFLFLYYYHVCVLCCYICGNKLFYSIMVLFVSFGPLVLYFVYQWFIVSLANGYVIANFSFNTIEILLPLFGGIFHLVEGTLYPYILFYLGVAAVYFTFTLVAARYRHTEAHHQSIAFKLLGYIIRFVMALTLASSALAFMQALTGRFDIILVYLITCLIVVYVVEMVFTKNAKVLYSLKYGVLLCGFIILFFQGSVKYIENYIPKNPESVTLAIDERKSILDSDNYPIENEKIIWIVKEIHSELIDEDSDYDHLGSIGVNITYQTGFNSYSQRSYNLGVERLLSIVEPFLEDDDFFEFLLAPEYAILERLEEEENLYFAVYPEYKEYMIMTDEQRYLFKNYLLEEIEVNSKDRKAFIENILSYSDDTIDIYKRNIQPNDRDEFISDEYIGMLHSPLIIAALQKTFKS